MSRILFRCKMKANSTNKTLPKRQFMTNRINILTNDLIIKTNFSLFFWPQTLQDSRISKFSSINQKKCIHNIQPIEKLRTFAN